MKTQSTQVLERPVRKRKPKKSEADVLAICPTEGAGWCPYPFSIEQLERHLKHLAEEKAAGKTQRRRGKVLVR